MSISQLVLNFFQIAILSVTFLYNISLASDSEGKNNICIEENNNINTNIESSTAVGFYDTMARPYTLRQLTPHFGAVVENFTITKDHVKDKLFMDGLKEDIHKYLVVLFKNQELPDLLQIDLSKALGRIQSTFSKHQASPHPDIFRVSNDRRQGCTGVGRTGWHIDGTFLTKPFAYQTMHFPSVNKEGHTQFVPLKQLYESQSDEIREKWNKRWFVASREVLHPLVYNHPVTGETTMCFHCGEPFCAAWAEAPGTNHQKLFESIPGQAELTRAIENSEYMYTMEWDKDDFVIMDNMAVAHYAVPGTQHATSLRILHRTTIEGSHEPMRFKRDSSEDQIAVESTNELPDHSTMRQNRGFKKDRKGYLNDYDRPEPSSSENTDKVKPYNSQDSPK